jgi:diacylglycerol kinase
MMTSVEHWKRKFAAAGHGLAWALRTQSSFRVHVPVAVAVIVTAWALKLQPWRWAVLLVLIGAVLSAELVNTAIEQLVKTLHPAHDRQIGRALDTAAAAVLVVALISLFAGFIVLGPPLWETWQDATG